MDIVTSLCVDTAASPESTYPQLRGVSADQRRRVYWQCTVVFFATSVRCNPGHGHVLYTNDEAPAQWGDKDYRAFLHDLGVETRLLPFSEFCPPSHFGREFRNAFYKLDVLRELARPAAAPASLLLDSDCIWTRPAPDLHHALSQPDALLLLDAEPDALPDTKIHGLSRRDMGDLYRKLSPAFPVAAPRHFGGEIIGGRRQRLAEVAEALQQIWQQVLLDYPVAPPQFGNGRTLFDNDEYLTSFVYNQLAGSYTDAAPFIRRIWTSYRNTNVQATDLRLPIWHMPNEKNQGIPLLCRRVLQRDSAFWRLPASELSSYLGRYLGVPQPLWQPLRLLAFASKLPRLLGVAKRLLPRSPLPA